MSAAGGLPPLERAWLVSKPGAKWRRYGPTVLPAWVADMDFPPPPPVRAALEALLAGGDLGYPDWPGGTPLREAFAERMARRHGWRADPGPVRELTDINQGLQLVLHLATQPGDGVAVHTPAYPPFLAAIRAMGRRLVPIPMEPTPGGWGFDAARAGEAIAAQGCRVLLVVNPHNPTGRVLTRAELVELGELAERHDLTVVADEIHADLVYAPARHVPFASLGPELARRTVTLTSATKGFNLAAIRCAVAHLGPPGLLAARDAQPHDLFGHPNVFGVTATLAAWSACDGWLAALLAQLDANRRLVAGTLGARLPEAGYRLPEGTYLAWLDLRALGLGDDPAAALLERGRIALGHGPDFGPGGAGFARLNFATSSEVLGELLDRLVAGARGAPGR